MKLFYRITFKIFLILTILAGCAPTEEIKEDAEAYYNRGNAYRKKGQYDRAISDYTMAIEINPKFAGAYNNRGLFYFFKREYEKAWDDVHKLEGLGQQANPKFLKKLREASGRQK